jgi:ElaB/YqjD/DUF883 family membrane-anchored ribosome-binding protein
MAERTEELRRDIAETRNGLGETLDAIGDRVSPARMIERRTNRITNSARALKDRVMGTVEDSTDSLTTRASGAADAVTGSPLVAGGVALGVGFLLAVAIPPSRREEQAAEQLMDKAEPVKQQLAESGKQVAGQLKETATEAVEQVKQAATEASDRAPQGNGP